MIEKINRRAIVSAVERVQRANSSSTNSSTTTISADEPTPVISILYFNILETFPTD